MEFLPESFMPESFKHLICSRIRVSTVACRMALHDMPNPHLVDQENCLAREKSQTGDTHRVSRRFPSRSYRLQLLRIKNTVYIYINKNISDGNRSRLKAIVQDMTEMVNAARNK